MAGLNILISGSGIAGSVFAFWILKAYPNANITMVEKAPSLRLTGASVDIRSSAVDVIKWMGAEEEIRKHSTHEEGVQFVEADDSEVATFRATGRTDIQSFTSEFEIFRGGLAKILIDPVLDQIKLIYDESIDHYEQQDDKVFVTFATSKETKEYDLLVAADGIGSKVRGTILNAKPRDQIMAEDGAHASYFTIEEDLLQGGNLAKWYNTTNGRCIFLRPDPSRRTRCNFINVTTAGDAETTDRLNEAMAEGNERYIDLMAELFEDAGWYAPQVIKGMRESEDFYCSLFAQVKSPKLVNSRVVLLGDAGYATPGFGTSLAIIGGYILAGELLNHPDDPKAALKGYEDIMLPFVKESQGGMRGAMQMVNPQTRWGIRIRNTILRLVTTTRLDKLAMNVSAMIGFSEKKAPIPDYKWKV